MAVLDAYSRSISVGIPSLLSLFLFGVSLYSRIHCNWLEGVGSVGSTCVECAMVSASLAFEY